MSCINRYEVFLKNGSRKVHSNFISTDCGYCLNCLIKKQSSLIFLANKELLDVYRSGRGASFVTLTYDESHLPVNKDGLVTLRKSDLQKWLKNMRRQMEYYNEKVPFKYVACGELGSDTSRPHYHICLLGLTDVQVRKYTRKLWKFGLCDIGVLGQGGLRYVCKYMTKAKPSKEIKKLRKDLDVENPFVCHSLGLGKDWINRNLQKITDDGFTFNLNGKINLFPRYVLRYVSAHTGIDYIPYVRKFILKDYVLHGKFYESLSQYDYEKSFIRYKNNVACLRSKNIAVDDITLSKKYVRPFHSFDRNPIRKEEKSLEISNLAFRAQYGDVIPF